MRTFSLEVTIPEGLREIGYSNEEICREAPRLLVLKRFRERAISSGKAAQILNISRRDFLDLLAREGIPVYDPTPEELAQDLELGKRLGTVGP